jgi:two-component system OmpR family response regulator
MERAVTERSIDLVLIDILVPTDEVLSLCRLVREAAGLPLILLAKRANEAHAIQALEYGADGYLIKPFSSQELLARVRAALCRSDEID